MRSDDQDIGVQLLHGLGDQLGRRALLSDQPLDFRSFIRQATVVPDGLNALDARDTLRQAEVPMALVHDKYGHFEGLVTPADLLDAIAGLFRSDEPEAKPEAV